METAVKGISRQKVGAMNMPGNRGFDTPPRPPALITHYKPGTPTTGDTDAQRPPYSAEHNLAIVARKITTEPLRESLRQNNPGHVN